MKRLYYVTNDLDDAEIISDEVHALGIDDHHFYVICRDEGGIATHHLHGGGTLENTSILAAKRRTDFFALIALLIFGTSLVLAVDTFTKNIAMFLAMCCVIYGAARFVASVATSSFDSYFKGVFDDHLDAGEAIIVIDVERSQATKVQSQLDRHPAASFIADSSNIASPIPI